MSTFTSEHPGVAHGPKSMGAPSIHYNVAIGYLRAFVTPLVLAHHVVLAYHPYPPARGATLVEQPRWWQPFPVVDAHNWMACSLFTASMASSSCR